MSDYTMLNVDAKVVPAISYPLPASNEAEAVLSARFDQLEDATRTVTTKATEYLDLLSQLFGDTDAANLWKNFQPIRYEDKDGVEMDITDVSLPTIPEEVLNAKFDDIIQALNSATFNPGDFTLETPEFNTDGITIAPFEYSQPVFDNLTPPSPSDFGFTEAEYSSQLYDPLVTEILYILDQRGVPLGTDVEQAIWERAKDRIAEQWDLEYNLTNDRFAQAGWSIPSGAHIAALAQVDRHHINALAQTNHEQTINLAMMARDSWMKALELGTRLEEVLRNDFNNRMNRLLEYARALSTFLLGQFEAVVRYNIAKADHYRIAAETYVAYAGVQRTRLDMEIAKVEVAVKKNEVIIQKMQLAYQAFKAQLDAINALGDNALRQFTAKASAFSENARLAIAKMGAVIERGKALLSERTARMNLKMETDRANLQALLQKAQLVVSDMEKVAGLHVQHLSSIYAAMNVGVSVSDSYQASFNHSTAYNQSRSLDVKLTEDHLFQETARSNG